ncbi:RNA polymerase-associated protein CTR9 [Marchantia polymorpha subsp. ruderalis]|uniref:Uncharacterized protein n=2 Tax=Marchantia polymorpha TaxID=3197 RepID=A0A176WI30_MARPO|nr:hypothetical protein AXG93_1089s1060 [Marchantia polymorpha subsp. ruderalis]PTQ46625.1 hypothetical protein MARPO_0010s0036 [Marchantia polymorpha]BBN12945.1 hypothetical protein Mp_5g24200 [Marchantia polymorpha subsp. ruderalis]|eukprot:PTQ46625.1 hypothetical protein MARPO_0010s0036 [Marchantia polymorpha]
MAFVYIPVQNSSEEVRVALDQLPRDATDILDILKAEQAPLNLWLTFAREYFKQGKINEFLLILREGSSPEIDEYYSDVKYDRIAILNALGAYYTNLGKVEQKQREKDEHFISATQFYNRASRIDQDEPTTWVGKGQLLLAKGDLDQSYEVFKIVLDGQPDNVPAVLGQACVQFNRGRFQEALNLYKRALQVHPRCPASVRLGLGLCRYRLGQMKKARQAFERVLKLDPENVEALVALGVMNINTNEPDGVREGLESMKAAYEIYPYCAMALNHLANHFFFTGQHYIVDQLMDAALAATDQSKIKAVSYYNLARSYHTKSDYTNAAVYYRASISELKDPREFILPYYGLGQVHLKLGDLRTSLSHFEKVLEIHPDNCETVKAIGIIYLQQGRTDKALENFKKATKQNPRDVDAWVELGELLVSTDFGQALEAFKTAHALLTKSEEPIPFGLLNNIGVLHFERSEMESALQAYRDALGEGIWVDFSEGRALSLGREGGLPISITAENSQFEHLEEEGLSLELPAEKVTVLFNLARLHEQQHETQKAVILYQLIIHKHPQYVDAYMRLAAMALARNDLASSQELVSKVLKVMETHADALSMRGSLELKADDWLKAKETYKSIQNTDGKDSYALLALGNWNYYAAVRGERKDPKLEATHLEKAKELYNKVLVQKPNNMYAANGIGIVLAEKGIFDLSKEVFTQVQEAAAGNVTVEMPDVWINLAHIYLAQGQFALAIKMYQNCLRRFYYNTESQVLLYLARTHYEAEQWQDCKRALLRAIHLAPSNYTLRFDAAIAMQKFSTATLQKPKRTADEVRQSVAELKNALRLFSQLSGVAASHGHGFDEKKIDMHVEYCKHLLDAAKVHLEAAEREEQQNRQKQEVARQLHQAEEARRKAEEERKQQMEKRFREEEARRLQREEEKLRHLMAGWNTKKGGGDNDDDDNGGEKKEKKEKKKRKKKEKKREQSSEPEEEGNYRSPTPEEEDAQDALAAAGLLEESDEEDMRREDPPPKKGRLRRALSESDDEDGSRRRRAVADEHLADSEAEMEYPKGLEDSDTEEQRPVSRRRGKKTRLSESDED